FGPLTPSLHGTSYTSSPTRKDKDRSVLPSPPHAPASELPPSPAPSDTANPSASVPASSPVPAQNPATAQAIPPHEPPHSPPQRQHPQPEREAAQALASPVQARLPAAALHSAEPARYTNTGSSRYQSAPSCLRTK